MKDERRASLSEEKAITIFDRQSAETLGSLVIFYDKFDKVGLIEGALFDASGKRIRKLKEKDLQDVSASGSSFASDSRAKIASLSHHIYPYTVWFRYQKSIKGLFGFPSWMPQDAEQLAVESARLEVALPSSQKISYQAMNLLEAPQISSQKGRTRYRVERYVLCLP